MLPFYFLSITTNLIIGLVLVFFDKTKKGEEPADREVKYPIFRETTFLLIVMIFSGFTAISKLLSPIGAHLPILGDFFPAISGLAGTVVFLGRYLETFPTVKFLPDFFQLVKNYDDIIGYVCLAASILHLFFSEFIFL